MCNIKDNIPEGFIYQASGSLEEMLTLFRKSTGDSVLSFFNGTSWINFEDGLLPEFNSNDLISLNWRLLKFDKYNEIGPLNFIDAIIELSKDSRRIISYTNSKKFRHTLQMAKQYHHNWCDIIKNNKLEWYIWQPK